MTDLLTYIDGAVYVGRFQPPHAAHLASIGHALHHAPRVLVLLGSANLARSVKNPWSAPERATMLRRALLEALGDAGADLRRVTFRPLPDRFDTEQWAADVRRVAANVFGPKASLALVGFEKDQSSAYLRWFPGWSRLNVPETPGLNATDIRRAYFTGQPLPAGVPEAVRAFLTQFASTPASGRLEREWQAVAQARAALPQDAALFEERWLYVERPGRQGQVWLHTRRGDIGQGLWELPGQVLPPNTRPSPRPRAPQTDAIFDHPARSLVAPATAYVSTAYVSLDAPPVLFPGRPVPLAYALARPRRFFEDHGVILERLVGRQ